MLSFNTCIESAHHKQPLQTKGRPTDNDIDRILNVEVREVKYSHKTGKSQHKSE